jgi:hypothetical protein
LVMSRPPLVAEVGGGNEGRPGAAVVNSPES